MKFARTYSAPGDPYAGVTFEPRDSRIVNPDGSVIFEAKDVMVPASWSQVAVDVLAQKYCRKAGVPKATLAGRRRGRARVAAALDRRRAGAGCAFARRSVWVRARRPPGLQPDGRMLDLLGLEARLLRFRKRRANLLRRDVRDARAPDRRAELAAMVQHRLALGVRHLRTGTGTLVRRSQPTALQTHRRTRISHPQVSACLPYHALVSTPDGSIPIGDIVDGKMTGNSSSITVESLALSPLKRTVPNRCFASICQTATSSKRLRII